MTSLPQCHSGSGGHIVLCYNGRTSFTIENDNDSEVSTQVARYLTEISNHYSIAIYRTTQNGTFLEWNNR